MNAKDYRNILAVCMVRNFAGREFLMGVLEEISNTQNWRLEIAGSGRAFSERDLTNEDGEPFDGYILSMTGADSVMGRIAASRTPTVLVNITDKRLAARSDAVASVWTDNADIGRRAAQHLLDRGSYKSAGYVHELKPQFYSTERMTAFRGAMKKAKLATSTFPDGDDFRDFRRRLRAWVRDLPKPAAVMAVSDMRASDVINACRAEGIAVPSQIAVVGVDRYEALSAECGMRISSVALNMRAMGRQAVQELDFIFRHPKWRGRPHEILIPAKDVFAAESTASSVSAARLVNMAQCYIAANRTRRISTDDVVRHLGCSRQLAKMRFPQTCGKTIRQMIEDARMDEANKRLKAGDTVREVVKAMHFTSANQLYRIYKRHFGHTIRQTGT